MVNIVLSTRAIKGKGINTMIKNKWEKFEKPIATSGNIYYFKHKVCVSCGLLVKNMKSSHGTTCRNSIDTAKRHKDMSECQRVHTVSLQKKNRTRRKAEGIKLEYECHEKIKPLQAIDKQFRVCLRCDKKFISQGKFNRICEPCGRHQEAIISGRQIDTSHIQAENEFMTPLQ